MKTSTATSGKSVKRNYYYRCTKVHTDYDYNTCQNRKSHRADRLEPLVWDYVSGVMKEPEQLRSDLDRMIELERRGTRGDPSKEAKLWADKLAETDRKRARYQEMAARDLITFDELGARLAELDETRKTAERELAALCSHEEYLGDLERERDAMLDSLEAAAPEALDSLTPEQRQHWYRMLKLTAAVGADGTVEISWAGVPDGESVCENATLSQSPAREG
jgi:Recombinase zinc beta ribbon domain